MFALSKDHKVQPTAFSAFIRGASSAEKKRVYSQVLGRATERQNQTLDSIARSATRPTK